MKVKYSWIPFTLVLLAGAALRVFQLDLFNIFNDGFFISTDIVSNIMLLIVVLFFVVMAIVAVSDKRTPYEFSPSKNIPLGIVGLLVAFSIFCSCTEPLISFSNKVDSTKNVVYITFSFIAGIVMTLEAISSITGNNIIKKLPVLAVFLPAWSCIRLIVIFMNYTSMAVSTINMFDLIALIFITVFFFYQGTIFADIPPKSAPKKLFVYGMPAILSITIYGIENISNIFTNVVGKETLMLVNNTVAVGGINKLLYIFGSFIDIIIAIYILIILIETSIRVKPVFVKETLKDDIDTTGDEYTNFIRQMSKDIKENKKNDPQNNNNPESKSDE